MLVRDNPLQTRKFHDQERGTPPVSIDGRCAEDKEIAAGRRRNRLASHLSNCFENHNHNDRVVKSVLNKFGAGRWAPSNGRPRSLPGKGVFVPSERGVSTPGELATAC